MRLGIHRGWSSEQSSPLQQRGPLLPSPFCTLSDPNRRSLRRHPRPRTIRDCTGTGMKRRISMPLRLIKRTQTRSLPLIPVFFPAECCASFALRITSASASFLSILVFFHFANVSAVTGVRLEPSLCLCDAYQRPAQMDMIRDEAPRLQEILPD